MLCEFWPDGSKPCSSEAADTIKVSNGVNVVATISLCSSCYQTKRNQMIDRGFDEVYAAPGMKLWN